LIILLSSIGGALIIGCTVFAIVRYCLRKRYDEDEHVALDDHKNGQSNTTNKAAYQRVTAPSAAGDRYGSTSAAGSSTREGNGARNTYNE
jgi:hypothetical protein